MTTVSGCERIIRAAGYQLIDSFQLPDEAWWKEFYNPLEKKMSRIKNQLEGDSDATAILDMTRKEISLFRKYSNEYGYQVFLLRKPG